VAIVCAVLTAGAAAPSHAQSVDQGVERGGDRAALAEAERVARSNPAPALLRQVGDLQKGGHLADVFFPRWLPEDELIELVVDERRAAALQSAVDALPDARSFVVTTSPHNPDVMQLELDRIVGLGTLPDGSTVTWAKPSLPDASGIVVGIQPSSSTASAERRSADADATLAVDAAVTAIGSAYDVVVEEGALPAVTAGARRTSTAPFVGGARMRNKASGVICTTGIPLVRTDRSDGLLGPAFLTADHCGNAGDEWVTSASTAPTLGRMRSFFSAGADLKFLEDGRGVSDFTTRRLGRLYSGPGNTYATIPIYGRTVPLLGTTVCMGGASSGTVCDAKINWMGVTYLAAGGRAGSCTGTGFRRTALPRSLRRATVTPAARCTTPTRRAARSATARSSSAS